MTDSLMIIRIWKTIQGEGPYAGTPAVFVRLAGCNVHCPWCDTDYETGKRRVSLQQVCEEVDKLSGSARLVVITGGEPLLQKHTCDLMRMLSDRYLVQIETSGTARPKGILPERVTVVCSPKPGNPVVQELKCRADAWKYIVKAGEVTEQGLPMDTELPPKEAKVYVQPMDEFDEEKNKKNLQEAIRICLEYGYFLSFQIHKAIGLD